MTGATALLALAVAALPAPGRAGASGAKPLDLIGTWHVLVHYTDDHAHDPEQIHWDDRVWIFEQSGNRLRWTEYPIVVFHDETGRFENLGGSHAARTLHGWEPNEGQLGEIASGLQVNDRGMKSKTLREQGDSTWHSTARPGAASASVITYVENWSIETAAEKPIFRREDVMGSGRSESIAGVTEYETTEVAEGGDLLRGSFERDGIRHGTFRMMRSGPTRAVEGSGKSQRQRLYEMWLGDFGAAVGKGEEAGAEEIERRPRESGEIPQEIRDQVRTEIRASIEKIVRDTGWKPRPSRAEVDELTDRAEKLMLEEGKSLEEVEQMIESGQLRP